MTGGYVGTALGRKEIIDIRVGTPTGVKVVDRAYVGTIGGNKQWYQRYGAVTITATTIDTTSIQVSWSNLGSDKFTYTLYRNGGSLGSNPGINTYQDTGLSPGVTYTYRIDAVRNGAVSSTATTTATTASAPPPPTTVDREWSDAATTSATYRSNGLINTFNRWKVMQGYFDGTNGLQKSTWNFTIPDNVRNCVRIRYVHMRVRTDWTWSNGGMNFSVVMHHNASQGLGSTSPFASFYAPKSDAWLGNGGEWVDITNFTVPGSFSNRNWTVAEEFRAGGAQGLGLYTASTSQSNYGYGWGCDPDIAKGFWPGLKIGYTTQG